MRRSCRSPGSITCTRAEAGEAAGRTPVKTPTTVTVGPSSASLIKIGDEQPTSDRELERREPDGGDGIRSSDNSTVATVDATGKAHAVNSGEATLIATTTGHGTGTLKIRVVPNYQGTWTGDYTVRGCTATGDFTPSDWCGPDLFRPGSILPIKVAFTQNADKLSGTITLGSIVTTLDAASSIAIDGGAHLSAQGPFTGDSINFTLTLNPVNFRANGPSMSGSFTQTWTAAGYAGSTAVSSDLNSVPRTSTLMGFDAGMPPRLLTLADIARAIRQK